jgi:hypothetical protein
MERKYEFWVAGVSNIAGKTYLSGRSDKGPILVGDEFTRLKRIESNKNVSDLHTWLVLETDIQPIKILSILLHSRTGLRQSPYEGMGNEAAV